MSLQRQQPPRKLQSKYKEFESNTKASSKEHDQITKGK